MPTEADEPEKDLPEQIAALIRAAQARDMKRVTELVESLHQQGDAGVLRTLARILERSKLRLPRRE